MISHTIFFVSWVSMSIEAMWMTIEPVIILMIFVTVITIIAAIATTSRLISNILAHLSTFRSSVILADSIRNYMSKFLSDTWMYENGFVDEKVPYFKISHSIKTLSSISISDALSHFVKNLFNYCLLCGSRLHPELLSMPGGLRRGSLTSTSTLPSQSLLKSLAERPLRLG